MGMDYQYSGSASYPRFEKEIEAIAKALGAEPTDALAVLQDIAAKKPLGYWFGCLQGAQPGDTVFAVPDSLPEAVSKWLNHPYESRTPAETAEIWKAVSAHPGIESLSVQVWGELRELADSGEGWDIS